MRTITRETVKNKEEYNLGVREREPRYILPLLQTSQSSERVECMSIHMFLFAELSFWLFGKHQITLASV